MQTCSLVLLLVWTLLLLQTCCVHCLRIPKDNNRLKSKCINNITSGFGTEPIVASRSPRCIALNHPYCLDLKLPYNATILPDFVTDLNLRSSQEVTEYLEQWRGVEKIPKCWPVLRVALCSLFMPQCEERETMLQLHQSSVDICNDLVKIDHCKFVERHIEGWPSIFNCSDSRIYAKNCSNELRELKHAEQFEQKQLTCHYPLVSTNDETNFFKDISGCALHCKYPIISPDEQANIKLTISILCLLGLTGTTTAMILYTIDQTDRKPSRMAKVMKRCTVCQLLQYIGWSLQLFIDREIGCRPDGSVLYGQPLVANLCVLSFLLTYLPSLSSLLWCAHLGKLFHEKLNRLEKEQENNMEIDRTMSILSYGIPLTLFVSVAFVGNIDGHGLYGICTVGQESIIMKTVFVFLPTLIGTVYGNYYFLQIIIKLAFTEEHKMISSFKRNLIRISALSALTILQIIFTVADYYYEHSNRNQWLSSIEDYVACQLDLTSTSHRIGSSHQGTCRIAAKPVATLYYFEILSTLGIGLVISSWAFCDSNYRRLRRKFIDLLMDDGERRRTALMYLEHDHNNPTGDNYLALGHADESDMPRYDPIEMNTTTQNGVDRAIQWNGRLTGQTELLPQPSGQPAPDPVSVAAMQVLLSIQSDAVMKMHSKLANSTNSNQNSVPTFTHALSSNPMPGQSDLVNNRVQRKHSFGPSEMSSVGSISLGLNEGASDDSESIQDNSLSVSKPSRRRLPRKRHASLKNFRSRHVIRDIKKQRLHQQGQDHDGNSD